VSWELTASLRIVAWAVASIETIGRLRDHRLLATAERLGDALRAVRCDLSNEAEALGREAATACPRVQREAESLLIGLLDSGDANVREGACIGLSFLPMTPYIEAALAAHEEDIP